MVVNYLLLPSLIARDAQVNSPAAIRTTESRHLSYKLLNRSFLGTICTMYHFDMSLGRMRLVLVLSPKRLPGICRAEYRSRARAEASEVDRVFSYRKHQDPHIRMPEKPSRRGA